MSTLESINKCAGVGALGRELQGVIRGAAGGTGVIGGGAGLGEFEGDFRLVGEFVGGDAEVGDGLRSVAEREMSATTLPARLGIVGVLLDDRIESRERLIRFSQRELQGRHAEPGLGRVGIELQRSEIRGERLVRFALALQRAAATEMGLALTRIKLDGRVVKRECLKRLLARGLDRTESDHRGDIFFVEREGLVILGGGFIKVARGLIDLAEAMVRLCRFRVHRDEVFQRGESGGDVMPIDGGLGGFAEIVAARRVGDWPRFRDARRPR